MFFNCFICVRELCVVCTALFFAFISLCRLIWLWLTLFKYHENANCARPHACSARCLFFILWFIYGWNLFVCAYVLHRCLYDFWFDASELFTYMFILQRTVLFLRFVYMCAAPWLALYSFLKCQTVNIDNAQCAHIEGGRHFMCMNAFTSIQKHKTKATKATRKKDI